MLKDSLKANRLMRDNLVGRQHHSYRMGGDLFSVYAVNGQKLSLTPQGWE